MRRGWRNDSAQGLRVLTACAEHPGQCPELTCWSTTTWTLAPGDSVPFFCPPHAEHINGAHMCIQAKHETLKMRERK